jgi:hypothetical protein
MAHQLQRTLRAFILILAWHGVALAQADAPITGQWTVGALAGDQVLLTIQRMNVNPDEQRFPRKSEPVPCSEPRAVRFTGVTRAIRTRPRRGHHPFRWLHSEWRRWRHVRVCSKSELADRMSSSGYSGLTPEKIFVCAVYDVGLDFARDIQRTDLEGVTLENLIRLAGPGITADWIRQVQSLGYPKLSVEDAIRLRGQGITPDYIREAGRRFKDVSINDLIRLKGAGIL